ncbi:TPA: hypothetical protein HA239_00370 [Candidatus Woesearchaeota archaeon]|nr:hypothetical protein QT06_C0001G0155 [archaeon GW2011_AR15]MBS3104043.1 hypothetical protein [Candidatus Woesearchaeota archaeon]HIH40853.1 hypothetical protein [Candidatus Woesearchaeota archaeon]
MKKIKFDKKLSLYAVLLLAALAALMIFGKTTLLLQVALFIFCFFFMLRFGSAFPLDLDPVPFCGLVVLQTSGMTSAILFLVLAAIAIDMPTGRFNHFTLINLASSLSAVLVFSYLLPTNFAIVLGILLFDITRILIALALRLGPQTILFSALHGAIYAVLGSVVILFI